MGVIKHMNARLVCLASQTSGMGTLQAKKLAMNWGKIRNIRVWFEPGCVGYVGVQVLLNDGVIFPTSQGEGDTFLWGQGEFPVFPIDLDVAGGDIVSFRYRNLSASDRVVQLTIETENIPPDMTKTAPVLSKDEASYYNPYGNSKHAKIGVEM